jgi:hypothetical protein
VAFDLLRAAALGSGMPGEAVLRTAEKAVTEDAPQTGRRRR